MNKAKLNEMLQNLGDRIIQATEGGARRLSEFDRAYANKVYEMQGGKKANPLLSATSAESIGDMLAQDVSDSRQLQALKYGAIGANLASRYALPAGTAIALQQALANLYGQASDMPIYPSDEA